MGTESQQTESADARLGRGMAGTLPGPEPSPAALRGPWLDLARAGWALVALISVGGFAASVPPYHERVRSGIARNMHAPDAVKAGLERLGVPFEAYALYHTAVLVVLAVVFFAVGAVIFWRRSDDPAALLFSATLISFGAIWPNTLDTLLDIHPVLDFLGECLSIFGFAAFFLMLYLFPDGRFVPRWTRWVALVFVMLLVLDTLLPGYILDFESYPPPFDLLEEATGIVFIGTMIYAQIHRYRRVSTPLQRQQTKWVVFALVMTVVSFIGTANLEELPVFREPGVPAALFGFFASITYGFVFMLVPIAIGAAVLRHRLWDIDPIVNRVVVYGILTAGVVAVYALVVGYLSALFRTDENLLFSLIATGVVAILFQPLRERLQRAVNRLMYGERDDPYAVVSRLGQRLERTLAPEAVLPTVVETVREALRLPYAAITLKGGPKGGDTPAAESGEPVPEPLRLPLVYRNELVGELLFGPRAPGEAFSGADRRLLDDLARQAGIAAHAVRLTADLQRSRERLVNAREEERRRLRRDLHDGLGSQLAGLNVQAGMLRRLIPHDPAAADEIAAELRKELQSAIADIRRLVYDLRPPALDDLGLLDALRRLAERYDAEDSGLRVLVEAPESGSLPHLPAAVEVAVYRIAQEALTNVARHARARNCVVRLAVDEGLRLEVTDDGVGLPAEHTAGVGLLSMRERAAELGGSYVAEPLPEGGTRVLVRLPLPEE